MALKRFIGRIFPMRLCTKPFPVVFASGIIIFIVTLHMEQRIPLAVVGDSNCDCIAQQACKPDFQILLNSSVRLPSICSNETCKSDYIKHFQKTHVYPIPAIRHIIWRNESVSEHFADQLRSWQRIHPDWTFVLWRDQDLEPFVATYFPGMLQKFKSLPQQIMRVDMIRYMLLFKFGGIYADLDYRLVKNLDQFRRFHAVLTREPEAHSIHVLGMSWPVKPFASAAFMMSAPGHLFFHFVSQQLRVRTPRFALQFAGPLGLTEIMADYECQFPIASNPMEAVYIPPSFSFFPYANNSMNSSRSLFLHSRLSGATGACKSLMSSGLTLRETPQLIQYCKDVNNMDSITDKSQPVFAIHDLHKTGAVYDGTGSKFYYEKLVDIRRSIQDLKFGQDFT